MNKKEFFEEANKYKGTQKLQRTIARFMFSEEDLDKEIANIRFYHKLKKSELKKQEGKKA